MKEEFLTELNKEELETINGGCYNCYPPEPIGFPGDIIIYFPKPIGFPEIIWW